MNKRLNVQKSGIYVQLGLFVQSPTTDTGPDIGRR